MLPFFSPNGFTCYLKFNMVFAHHIIRMTLSWWNFDALCRVVDLLAYATRSHMSMSERTQTHHTDIHMMYIWMVWWRCGGKRESIIYKSRAHSMCARCAAIYICAQDGIFRKILFVVPCHTSTPVCAPHRGPPLSIESCAVRTRTRDTARCCTT